MELAILELLERHQTLAYPQIAAVLHERPYGLRGALGELHERGLIEFVGDGKAKEVSRSPSPVARCQLTDAGREELAQWR